MGSSHLSGHSYPSDVSDLLLDAQDVDYIVGTRGFTTSYLGGFTAVNRAGGVQATWGGEYLRVYPSGEPEYGAVALQDGSTQGVAYLGDVSTYVKGGIGKVLAAGPCHGQGLCCPGGRTPGCLGS